MFNTKIRLPLVTTGLAIALSCMPLLGEDKAPVEPSRTTTAISPKQVTLTGKVVCLHEYMTGERDPSRGHSDSKINRITPVDPASPNDRTKPDDSSAKPGDKDKHAGKMMKNEIMGLETSTGLVLLCLKDAPGIYATPLTDDKPSTKPLLPPTPGTREKDADRPAREESRDSGRWLDKQVQVTGSMYEKSGIKFFVVTKVVASFDATTPRSSTTPDAAPQPK